MNHITKHPFCTALFICIGIAIGIMLEKVRVSNEKRNEVIAKVDSIRSPHYQQTIDSLQAANVDLQNQINFYEDK